MVYTPRTAPTFIDVTNFSDRKIQKMGHNDNNDYVGRPTVKPTTTVKSTAKKVLRKVRYPADFDETAE